MGKSSKPEQPQRAFAALEPRMRHVSEKAIRKKWTKLNNGTQDHLRQLFLSLKSQATVSQSRRMKFDGCEDSVEELTER
jgi:hypothetical protein